MNHYKSWSNLNKQLSDNLCKELKGRITYFLTRYHDVHNAYGRASIRWDNQELVNFNWSNGIKQELESSIDLSKESALSEFNFLEAATSYLNLSIQESLKSDNYLIKVFAIMDKRVGKRSLEKIKASQEYQTYPEWVKQFYRLRLDCVL